MEFQKVVIVAVMAVLVFSQVLLAAPLLSEEVEAERLPSAINRIVSSLQSEDSAVLSRNKRYVVIQIMGKIAQNERSHGARHPRLHRFHHRHHRPQTIPVKKQ